MEEDPTLRFEQDPETHEAIIAGMGELHVEVTRDRLKRKFNVDTVLGNPNGRLSRNDPRQRGRAWTP